MELVSLLYKTLDHSQAVMQVTPGMLQLNKWFCSICMSHLEAPSGLGFWSKQLLLTQLQMLFDANGIFSQAYIVCTSHKHKQLC